MSTTVLVISHTAVSHAAGRLRYAPLAGNGDLDLHLLVPERWCEFGRELTADRQTMPGVTLHVAPARLLKAGPASWYLHHYPGLSRLLREIKPDVIHLWEESWSVVAQQAILLRNKYLPMTPIILEVDQNISRRLPYPFRTLRRNVLRQTDFLLARSMDAVRVARLAGYRGAHGIIGYGVDQAAFRPLDRTACRAQFGMHGPTIGYVGRLVQEKGLDDLLDAMARMRSKPSLALLGQGEHETALLDRARSLGLADRVSVHRWGNPGHVASFLNAIDLSVLLTRTSGCVREQFGRVIIESQACGTPVVGSTCGAIPDVIGDGGWIVPERSPAALADCLNMLCDDAELLRDAGRAGLRQVEQRFTYQQIAKILTQSWELAHIERSMNAGSLEASNTPSIPHDYLVRGRNWQVAAGARVGRSDTEMIEPLDRQGAASAGLPWLSMTGRHEQIECDFQTQL